VISVRQAPAACPRCGGERIARLLWGDKPVVGEELPDALAGTILLAGRELPEDVPLWSCLTCQPGWLEVHQCAVHDRAEGVQKQEAIARRDYEAGALCRAARREHGVASASCWRHWCQTIRAGSPSRSSVKKRGRGPNRNNGSRPLLCLCPQYARMSRFLATTPLGSAPGMATALFRYLKPSWLRVNQRVKKLGFPHGSPEEMGFEIPTQGLILRRHAHFFAVF
jgi:hypothetical protein